MPLKNVAQELVERLFAGVGQPLRVDADEVITREGEPQHRLYFIRSGFVVGTKTRDDGVTEDQIMRAGTGDLIGVLSFFGGTQRAAMTVTAIVPTDLLYIERDWQMPDADASIERQMMPSVIAELTRRHQTVLQLLHAQQEAHERIRQLERTSALGSLAAGVAHELNNAITVIARGTEWLGKSLGDKLQIDDTMKMIFQRGIEHGRAVSSAEVRQRTAELKARYKLHYADARRLAQTGLDPSQLTALFPLGESIGRIIEVWEIGATLADMQIAAHQAEHVVASMRDLGGRRGQHNEQVDVNGSIEIALKILRNALKGIAVNLHLGQLPMLAANRGELVQIWTNLLRNAADALHGAPEVSSPQITITTAAAEREIVVEVADNGPGIPEAIARRIFEPSFTTKKSGLSFGLGLGLGIVQNLVTEYGGQIELLDSDTSQASGATFRVTLPLGALPCPSP